MSTIETDPGLKCFINTFTYAKYLEILWNLIKDKEDVQNIIKSISLIETGCNGDDRGKKATINDLHLHIRTVTLTRGICETLGAYQEEDFDRLLSRLNMISDRLRRSRPLVVRR